MGRGTKQKTKADYDKELEELHTCYIRTFRSGEGQVVLKDLARALMYDRTIVVRDKIGRVDSHMLAFNEGMREAYRYITSMVEVAENGRSGDTGTPVETGDVFDERGDESVN